MSTRLDHAILALDALKPVVKVVPVVGQYLEGIADLLRLTCSHAKGVKSNKEDVTALAERAVRCMAVIVEKAQQMPKADIDSRMGVMYELKQLVEELVRKTSQQAERSAVSRVVRKDRDKEDIVNLSKRLDQVILRFGMEVQLGTMYGLEDVVSRVRKLQIGQEQAKEVQLKTEQNALLLTLNPVASARHDHDDAPRGCTKGTRVSVIERIIRWVMDLTTLQTIFWLSGLAGTGKTAIMKTLSERLAELGVLGGCFFISIKSEDRRKPQNITRTLAYQLARFQPLLCEPICNVLRNNPDVVSQAMASQIPALLLDPFIQVVDQIKKPVVILIDAMDECDKIDDVEGGSFLSTLLSVLRQHPAKLKLIVTSRLSSSIRRMFNEVAAERFRLHEIEKEIVKADIQLYLEAEFEGITRSRELEHSPRWYTPEDLIEFVSLAGSLFIYAFTVVRWISNTRFTPRERLRQILGWRRHDRPHSPFQAIDDLYQSVLHNALGSDPNYHNEVIQQIHELLEVLVVAFEPLTIPELAKILQREEEAVRLDLEQLSAVLPVPERGSNEPVVIYHASFVDYLTDAKRCPPESGFYVSVWEAHGQTGTRCLNVAYEHRYGNNRGTSKNYENEHRPELDYALKKWRRHLELSPKSSGFLNSAVKKVRGMTSRHREDTEALFDLSFLLHEQSVQTNQMSVISEKIIIDRQLVKLVGSSHPSRGLSLTSLADGLLSLYKHNGDQQLLHEAIILYREALERRPPGHPSRDWSLNDLAAGLSALYQQNGDVQLLYEAISLDQEALKLRSRGHPYRNTSLSSLATNLRSLYLHNGDEQLLHAAISLLRQALKLCPPGHPSRDRLMSDLAVGISSLHQQSGDEQFLHESF